MDEYILSYHYPNLNETALLVWKEPYSFTIIQIFIITPISFLTWTKSFKHLDINICFPVYGGVFFVIIQIFDQLNLSLFFIDLTSPSSIWMQPYPSPFLYLLGLIRKHLIINETFFFSVDRYLLFYYYPIDQFTHLLCILRLSHLSI